MTSDDRMTWGLVGEVLDVLERHGYHRYDNRHTAQAVGVIADLASLYEGTHDPAYATYPYQSPPTPHAEPGPPAPQADDAVILTDAEVSTVVTALNIAARDQRDHAVTCAHCTDQTCQACQSRLQDARAYHHMATQMLQTAEASRAASTYRPELDGGPEPPRQPCPAADKEAGQ